MKLVPGSVQQLKRLEGERINIIQAIEKIARVLTVIPAREEYVQMQIILDGWLMQIEAEIDKIQMPLMEMVQQAQWDKLEEAQQNKALAGLYETPSG